ncbi:dTDP-4-dehydrorhamnose 3,5-epimerase [Weissella diestrammenae]|uniref:dTDP-4-dehydrorhamnose 3,5-epimerase n=1 Tax=Weissella diestrammenae TaxID=1162633 RepID=A0A7G9T521_9LACO|nr:dTDP-4-dehydrorhamnose 3,5-epimerase [Weissella diestrammenae]MCM0582919.1 dTDP-4-dehydrorhamnose 3,5-epimerase [Weissella diestrammenae]QNN75196.1 dTDP-4-dehydrorhamnose 3,5-epimerase [Weissella diestrammenae]
MTKYNVIDTKLQDVKILEQPYFGDSRGFLTEDYSVKDLLSAGIDINVVLEFHSYTANAGTLRGLHIQDGIHSQAKLVRVITGVVYDVLVDVRKGSPTFGHWQSFILSESNGRQLYVPRGFAHGWLALSDNVNFTYKVDNYYAPESETPIAFDDPMFNIEWPIAPEKMILSDKDRHNPNYVDAGITAIYGEI